MPAWLLPDDQSSLIIAFDQTRSEGHEATAEVTSHPVEQGSSITDHVRPNPLELNLELYITNTPITDIDRGVVQNMVLDVPQYTPPIAATPGALFSLIGAGITSTVQEITGPGPPITVTALTFPTPFDRIKEYHVALLDLRTRGQTMSVVTSVKQYDGMVLTSVSLPRTEPGGASFNLGFKQISTVTTNTVQAPKPVQKRGAPASAKGAQSTKTPNDQDASKVSLAKKLWNQVTGVP